MSKAKAVRKPERLNIGPLEYECMQKPDGGRWISCLFDQHVPFTVRQIHYNDLAAWLPKAIAWRDAK